MEVLETLLSAPVPAKTRTYTPVAHADVLNLVDINLDKLNLNIVGKHLSQAADGKVMLAQYAIDAPFQDYNYQLAFMNSYNKRVAFGVAAGMQVMICANGMVTGDTFSFKKKHNGGIDDMIAEQIRQAAASLPNNAKQMMADIERMKTCELKPNLEAQLVNQLFLHDKVISTTQMSILREEYHGKGSGLWNTSENKDMWHLYNNLTEAAKTINATNRVEALKTIHDRTMKVVTFGEKKQRQLEHA